MQELENIKQILQEKKLRITTSRLAVATFLIRDQSSTLRVEDLYAKISRSKKFDCDQVSVYRTLTLFEDLGIVIKTQFQGEAARYSLAPPLEKRDLGHEHYFKCDKCNVIESLESCLVAKKEVELKKSGYRNLKHHIEITGLCPRCV